MVKKKYLVSFLLSFCLIAAFAVPALAASQKIDCSYAGIQCKEINVYSYGTSSAYSDYIYAIAGQKLSLSIGSDGPFNLSAQAVDSSGNVFTPEITYHQTVFFNAPRSGNYRVKVVCHDGSSYRCTGFGSISQ